jgi:integrase
MATNAKTATGKMKGGVRKRGRFWEFVLYLGMQPAQRCNECGRREWVGPETLESCPKCGGDLREAKEPRTITRSGFPTKEAADDGHAAMRTEYKRHGNAPELVSNITLAEFLRKVWVPDVKGRGSLKRTTKEGYVRNAERHLIGPAGHPFALGLTELRKLTTKQVKAHYKKLAEGYEAEGILRTKYGRPLREKKTREVRRGLVQCKGLSEMSIRRVHATLHAALEMASSDEHPYLSRNPAKGAAKELGDADAVPRELPAWSEEELLAFIASQRETEYGPLWRVLAYTGMRRGEAIGLQRGDVDLDAATLTVRRTRVPVKAEGRSKPGQVITSSAKTKRIRTVDLDPETVEVLRAVLWASVSPADLDQGASDARWVFSGEAGEPLNPNTVSYEFRKAVAASGLRAIPLHGLRHTHATILLSAGVPVHIVSSRLGHSNPTITMNVYAHCLPRAQAPAVAYLANMGAEHVK